MPAYSPEVTVLRNRLVKALLKQGMTYEEVGKELGISKQGVYKLVVSHNLDGNSKVVYSKAEKRIISAAKLHGVAPPVPIQDY